MDEAKKKMTGTPVIFFSFCRSGRGGSGKCHGTGEYINAGTRSSTKKKPAAAATGSFGSGLPI